MKKFSKSFKKSIVSKSQKTTVPLWVLITFALALLTALIILYFQFKPTLETRQSQVRNIPAAVQRSFPKPPLSQSIHVPILLYHYVEYVSDRSDTIRQSLNIQPHIFEQQIKTLKSAGFTFMTASELSDVLDGKKDLPPKPVLITFDDGHRDFFTDALPIIQKYNVKVTQYVISGLLDGPDFMTQEQLRQIVSTRLVEIGGHTVHHVALSGKLFPVAQFEVQKNKSDLEKMLGIKLVSFAYPNGSFDEQAINLVKSSGYKSAVSTVSGVDQSQNNRFFLYRLRPGYMVGETLIAHLEQSSYPGWKK